MYLGNLTKVTASFWMGLRRLDFSFDREVPAECRSFGRHQDPKYGVIEFPIDGPGGEVIDSVEICQQYPDRGALAAAWIHEAGQLCSLKVSLRPRLLVPHWLLKKTSLAPRYVRTVGGRARLAETSTRRARPL